MISVFSEITDDTIRPSARGWIFYDGDCRSCFDLVLGFRRIFSYRGYVFEPLQEPWVQRALRLAEAEALTEVRVLTREGKIFSGADAILFLAAQVWWLSPLSWIAKLPGVPGILRRLYRWIAAHRHCRIGNNAGSSLGFIRWLPLLILPPLVLITRPHLPAWKFMWEMAIALYFGCKWLTLCLVRSGSSDAGAIRSAAYLLAWPGMDARRFLFATLSSPIQRSEIVRESIVAVLKMGAGSLLLFVVARSVEASLLAGWIGMVGMVLMLHFGLFELISTFWRALGIDAPPIMNAPLRSTSISGFWGRRWNGAFNQLALRLVFKPLARHTGTTVATLGAFGASGLVHELVISLPANAGYGLPTAYFALQGIALIIERTSVGKYMGLGRGVSGWLFTMSVVAGPAFWLFHPAFVRQVILPFMQAIGAL